MATGIPSIYRVLFTEVEYVMDSLLHLFVLDYNNFVPRKPVRQRVPDIVCSGGTLVNSDASPQSSPVRVRPISPCGLVRFQHFTQALHVNEAMQEISCEYNQLHKSYIQYIQFALGGVSAPQIAGTVSPCAVFRTWPEDCTEPEPFWVKYHKAGYTLRPVSADFAIGRIALLAQCCENMCISRDLLNWAEKFNPLALALPDADLQWLSNCTPEDRLTVHQGICEHFNAYDASLNVALEARRERKRLKREAAASAVASTSTVANISAEVPFPDNNDAEMPDFDDPSDPLSPPHEATPPPGPTGRGARAKCPTWKLLQQLPPPAPEFPELPSESDHDDSDSEFPEAPWLHRTAGSPSKP
ncbi:hypothetical protein B0H17DRAFT_1135896 [Mycena rosella]|uniref:Uncharacterized protein n=1 Tax=Mycena rosella TaxID=1033263 RepID=A0AAD7DBX6_MYCRO|nr:hypothetical protein B0H17DRAFT_1135896 [Mycena rosella]